MAIPGPAAWPQPVSFAYMNPFWVFSKREEGLASLDLGEHRGKLKNSGTGVPACHRCAKRFQTKVWEFTEVAAVLGD